MLIVTRDQEARAELHLPRVQPLYADAQALVAALGCRVVADPEAMRVVEFLGHPPSGDAALRAGGEILTYGRKVHVDCVIHEAVHWYLGPGSLDDEGVLMPVQLSLVRRIASDEDRRAALHSFCDYGIWGGEIGGLVDEHGPGWVLTDDWTSLCREARSAGWALDGTVQEVSPSRWYGYLCDCPTCLRVRSAV